MTEIEKLQPQNLDAEKSLLGSLLIDKEAIIKIADIITPEDFYSEKHRAIFESILDVYKKHDPIDILSVSNRLGEKKKLEEIGGKSYLMNLANSVPTSSHVVNYANIVQKKATLRRLISATSKIHGLAYSEEEDIEKILDTAEQSLFAVSQKFLKQFFLPISSLLTQAFDRIDELHRDSGKLRGLPTGYADLDNLLAGLQRSDLIILAARPSVGKTSLAMDIARKAAIKHGAKVGIFSLEMSKEQLVDRLLCAQANVGLWKMRTGKLSDREEDDDFTKIGHAMGVLSESAIYIDDSATSNIMEIRTKARRLSIEKGLDLLVIDYLQLLEGRGQESRVQEISEITRALKAIARELNIPVLVLSQLSRATEARSPAIPKLADLRDSGSIEQDADVVMFIYRKSYDKSVKDVSPDERYLAEIHVQKHRNGPTGVINLFFDEDIASFKSLEKRGNMINDEAPF